MMIEDAVNVMNDISVNYGELDCITELSKEQASSSVCQSGMMTKSQMQIILMKSILDTIPSELSAAGSIII